MLRSLLRSIFLGLLGLVLVRLVLDRISRLHPRKPERPARKPEDNQEAPPKGRVVWHGRAVEGSDPDPAPQGWARHPRQETAGLRDLGSGTRPQWGTLPDTDPDAEPDAGQGDRLVGRIQSRYGRVKEEAAREVDDWIASQPEAPPPTANAGRAEPAAPTPATKPAPKPAPEPLGDAILALKDPQRARFGRASALLRAPRRMFVERWELVQLRLSPGAVLAAAAQAELERSFLVTTTPADPQSVRTDKLDVDAFGRRMAARLEGSGDMFRIKALNSGVAQDMVEGRPMRWNWEVMPLRAGHGVLRVQLTVRRDMEGKALLVEAPSLEAAIEVVVGSRAAHLWRWLRRRWVWGTALTAIGVLIALASFLTGRGAP